MTLGAYPWIPVESGVPRGTALVWAAVKMPDGLVVPILAQRRQPIGRKGAVWYDLRSRRPIEEKGRVVTHWRGLQVPDPPTT